MRGTEKYLIAISCVLFWETGAFAQNPSANGRELYQEHCSKCHGENLEGGTAPSLVDGVWLYGADRSNRMRNIRFGIAQQGMPSYEEVLTNRQIRDLAIYMEEAGEEFGATKPPIPDVLFTNDYEINVTKWVEGLEIPWSIDFLDESTALVAERPGRLRIIKNGVLQAAPVSGIPDVLSEGQGGLMDVAVDPAFSENGWIYLSYSHELKGTEGGRRNLAMTRVVRGRVKDNSWADEQVIFEAPRDTYSRTRHHYGCRIVFDSAGYLYFSVGDRGAMQQAQLLNRPNGKVHRIHTDGKIPTDNPFYGQEDALKSIFSYGHRNPQGLTVHPETGVVWDGEHGPMGGDEVNILEAGVNYGWPEITYGRNYNGDVISEFEQKPGMAQPVLFWRPSIAVCAIDFYRGGLFRKWENRLLVGSLAFEDFRLLTVDKDRILHQEVVMKNAGRVRDLTGGPDGAIYVVLNNPGTILRLTPVVEEGF